MIDRRTFLGAILGLLCSPAAALARTVQLESALASSAFCPNSGFYVAKTSAWLSNLTPSVHKDFRHYVVDGRDGYVELIADRYSWREWLWVDSHREEAPSCGPEVGSGNGAE